MKGDFSRSTFRRASHYDGVRLQQGRVLLDAEANELVDILNHLRTTTARDVIGPAGAPRYDDGFRVAWADGTIAFTSGRFYVDGILCESEGETIRVTPPGTPAADVILDRWSPLLAANKWIEVIGRDASGRRKTAILKINAVDANARKLTMGNVFGGFSKLDAIRTTNAYLTQPDYLNPAPIQATTNYLVWLDVWQRHITHLEDRSIREKALGGPDTTTRTKTVWQVRLAPGVTDCKTFVPPVSTGRLAARDQKPSGPPKQCEIAPQAGYRRLENQLYRVEIHTAGNRANARFKWSRDNGSIVFAIEAPVAGHPEQLKLKTIGRDALTHLQPNDWVEVIDDIRELDGQPGTLLQVSVPPAESDHIVTLSGSTAGTFDINRNARLRLWQSGLTTLTGDPANQNFVALEDGVEVKFENGDYRTGDYWLIPARTAISEETGHVEWPVDGANNPLFLPAEGITHHFAPLATIDANGNVTHDCRPLFPPLTSPDLFYLAGDGQPIALTNPTPPLPQTLDVLVSNGAPVQNATVKFAVTSGGGTLNPASGEVMTGADGRASITWTPGNPFATQRQTVTATLIALESASYVPELPPITFNAWAKLAKDVIYTPGACDYLKDTNNVQDALDKLCKRPSGGGICTIVLSPEMDWAKAIRDLPEDEDAEICFRAGTYKLDDQLELKGKRRLTFNGIGEGSRIIAPELADAILFFELTALIMRDLSIESSRVRASGILDPDMPGVVTARGVAEATFADVAFRCGSDGKTGIACLAVSDAKEVRVSRCDFDVAFEQLGFVATKCEIVQVESSRFSGPGIEFVGPLVLRAAFPQLTFDAPSPQQNVRFQIGDQNVAFAAPAAEVQEWQAMLPSLQRANPQGREAVSNTLASFAAAIAAGAPFAERVPNLSRRLVQTARPLLATRARQAITVLKSANVTVRDNVITGFARGILGGIFYNNNQRNPLELQRAFIHDNSVTIVAPGQRVTGEHGIDVGTVEQHLTIRGNYVESSQVVGDGDQCGFFVDGNFGALAILRDNQARRFAIGFHAQGPPPPANMRPKVKWLLADNIAAECATTFSPNMNTTFDRDNTI